MKERRYRSMPPENAVGRRDFLKAGGALGAGLVLTGRSLLAAQQTQGQQPPAKRLRPVRTRPAPSAPPAFKKSRRPTAFSGGIER